jgi:NAD(P)-dependent dehydrogenase (short-subunit alcohol dehydrogenase family)
MTNQMKATGSVIIVTGASGNLGGAVIAQLAATGARVVAVERTRVLYGDDVLAPIDLGRADVVQSAFASVAERLGGIDGVVHTVGVYQGGRSLLDTSTEDFTSLFQTNVVATANVLRAAIGVMLPQRRGQIAVVASADALSGAASRSAYSASKGAQLRVVESAAQEVRGHGITLNAVLPGTMDTPQNRAAQPNADRASWLSLDAVAQVLAYLVSPSAAAIHGEAIRLGRSPAQ